ncbi:MAG: hypothetical protein ACR2MD_13300 [Aridibacter sp.]
MLKLIDRPKRMDIKNKYAIFALILIVFAVIACSSSKSSKTKSDGKFSDVKGKTTFGKELIKQKISRNSKVGEFELIGINTEDSVLFKNALETVTAVYKNETSGDSVVHSSSLYMNWEDAEEKALKILDNFKKVDKKLATRKSDGYISSIFKGKDRSFYMECKKDGKLGLCQLISSDKPVALKDYTNTFFGSS